MKPDEVELEIKTLQPQTVIQTVQCNGVVEPTASTSVSVPADCIVGDVKVKNGQSVKKGDVLFTVDTEKTLTVLAQSDASLAVQSAISDTLPKSVTAPADGRISGMSLHSGDVAVKDVPAAMIEASDTVQIRLSIPERNIRRVRVGQQVRISGMGFQHAQYQGNITEIADTAKREMDTSGSKTTVEAVVTLSDAQSDASMRVGLNAKAAIQVQENKGAFIVPYESVLADDDGKEYVYIYQDEDVQKRVITPAAELAGGYMITDGMTANEQLVLTPEKIVDKARYVIKGA